MDLTQIPIIITSISVVVVIDLVSRLWNKNKIIKEEKETRTRERDEFLKIIERLNGIIDKQNGVQNKFLDRVDVLLNTHSNMADELRRLYKHLEDKLDSQVKLIKSEIYDVRNDINNLFKQKGVS